MTYFAGLDLSEGNAQAVKSIVVQPLSDILSDYQVSIPELREAEVLQLFTKAFEKLNVNI